MGADRGTFSLALANAGFQVYAVENKKGPFENLRQNISQSQFEITCLFSNGIDILPKEVDTCCILGMGGNTIYDILSKDGEKLSQLSTILIEPQSNASLPISFLLSHGFRNDEGKYVYEKRYYPLLRFVKGEETNSDLEIKYGPSPVRKKDPLLKCMIEKEIQQQIPYLDQEKAKEKYCSLKKEWEDIYFDSSKTFDSTR